MPPELYVWTSKWPIAFVARYVAIGSVASQFQVVRPAEVLLPRSFPFAIAWSPAGAVMWKVNDALSRGWSLAGNQLEAPWGSPATIAPSSVWMNPEAPKSSSVAGMPSYAATTVNVDPFVIPLF